MRIWRKENHTALLVGMQVGAMQPLWKIIWNFLKKLNSTALWPSNSILGYISEKIQNTNLKEYMHPRFHCRIIYKSQAMKAIQMLINRRVNKNVVIYTMEYYLAIKKNEILPFATVWMDLEGIVLNEISQSDKDKYHMISAICGI